MATDICWIFSELGWNTWSFVSSADWIVKKSALCTSFSARPLFLTVHSVRLRVFFMGIRPFFSVVLECHIRGRFNSFLGRLGRLCWTMFPLFAFGGITKFHRATCCVGMDSAFWNLQVYFFTASCEYSFILNICCNLNYSGKFVKSFLLYK